MSSGPPIIDDAEVVVVGAGPAGCAAAISLSRLGREVILVDQNEFPRDKACGDGLWSASVRLLMEMGFADLVADAHCIEGVRATRAIGGAATERPIAALAHLPQPRCIPRFHLDQALLSEALAGGVRFVLGKAENLLESDGHVIGLAVRGGDGLLVAVGGQNFVAADGATSRLRRLSGFAQAGPRAYAVRQYFRSEKPLAPVFDIQVPLNLGGRYLGGYSWVFPVSDHIANIGVGYFRPTDVDRGPLGSIRSVLDGVIDELQRDPLRRYGDLEATSDPLGAPVAIGFSTEMVKDRNVYFVGDAANMADPYNAEGIAAALDSGRTAAHEVNETLKRGPRRGYGNRLRVNFPRLGQDTGVLIRMVDRIAAEAWPAENGATESPPSHSFVRSLANGFLSGFDDDAGLEATGVFQLVTTNDDELSTALTDFNSLLFDSLRTEFPFALDSIYRRLCSGVGPSIATTLLASERAWGGVPSATSLAGALAGELLSLAVELLGDVTVNAAVDGMGLGNGLTTFTADFALSHGLRAASSLGSVEVIRLARLAGAMCEGATAEADDAWALGRTENDYLVATGDNDGSIHGHAASLGARLAGSKNHEADMTNFGRNLGIAFKISNDVVELLRGDAPTASDPGGSIRRGRFSLPVIYALEEDHGLAELLTENAARDRLDEAVTRIIRSQAMERSLQQCLTHGDLAREALESADVPNRVALAGLIDLATTRCGLAQQESK